ncbi:hydrogen peroxide-inducible genes activator [Zavarzinia compransoris]|uniref:hydrogen peroxide-inducible genes activator n=1 Tax=Zavarzinia marina TaxID=2911065 RepID=UPI001F2422A0|nr:hydrogen peroxide-inducible genes activator [Zavarzinia marina]MCF4166931.1 hydrogen peroxide-inducible genes activator [Zavarzinia marina]
MPISLRQIRYLVAVADHQSFRKAAAALNVSQPAMTAQIQLLEQALDGLVLTRSRRGVTPTALGEAVIAKSRHILAEVENLRALGAAAAARPLRLGIIPTIAPYIGPDVVEMGAAYAAEGLEVVEGRTAELLASLRNGTLDAALLAMPTTGAGLGRDIETAAAFSESFYALLPDSDPLAGRMEIDVQALTERPLLLLEEGHCLADQALSVCGEGQQRAPIRAASLATLSRLVARGKGITLLPAMAVGVEFHPGDGTVLRPLPEPAPGRTVGLAWRKGATGERCWRRLAQGLARLKPGVDLRRAATLAIAAE